MEIAHWLLVLAFIIGIALGYMLCYARYAKKSKVLIELRQWLADRKRLVKRCMSERYCVGGVSELKEVENFISEKVK